MIAEILTIGNEILDGRITDTNRTYIGKKLSELGIEIRYAQSVDDNLDRVVSALELASSRSDLIICTGGLGPTTDDLTAEAVAKFLGCAWDFNVEAEKFVRGIFEKRNRQINESQLKQAKLPVACKMISNPVGTAPGFSYVGNRKGKDIALYFFPGVPKEMYPMFESAVLSNIAATKSFKKYTWSTLFTSEGDLQEQIKDAEKGVLPFRVGFRTHLPENHVSLMGNVKGPEDEKKWRESLSFLSYILSPLCYHEGEERDYEEVLLEKLIDKKVRVLFVESCTAGLSSHLLSEVSGSSKVLWGSQVCYANEEKMRLGVKEETLKRVGAVSAECAEEMAQCGMKRLKQDKHEGVDYLVCVSTTGIAGPTGGSVDKPVGTMYTSIMVEELASGKIDNKTERVQAPHFLERKLIKLYFAKKALENLRTAF